VHADVRECDGERFLRPMPFRSTRETAVNMANRFDQDTAITPIGEGRYFVHAKMPDVRPPEECLLRDRAGAFFRGGADARSTDGRRETRRKKMQVEIRGRWPPARIEFTVGGTLNLLCRIGLPDHEKECIDREATVP